MFHGRPIAREDLPAVLTLSERTGTGLTTLPANRERLAERIDRSPSSFAGGAKPGDACYVFVLVDSTSDRVAGIAKPNKIGALDRPALTDIEAWNDALSQHILRDPPA